MALFDRIPLASPDPIFGIQGAFKADTRKEKVNLTVGAFKTEALETPIMRAVKEAEREILEKERHKEYLPIEGGSDFCEAMGELVFGKKLWGEIRHRTAVAQAVGGTGALYIGGRLLLEELELKEIALPDPTWTNHRQLFVKTGFEIVLLPYYDYAKKKFHAEAFFDHLKRLPAQTPILLHASCHNPSGSDPTEDDWIALSDLMLKQKQLPFFDIAYQGMGQGVEEDVLAPRYFAKNGHEMVVTYTCSKNFSVYAERTGALFFVCESAKAKEHVQSKMKALIRTVYSNPPLHGGSAVALVLKTPYLFKLWQEELEEMRVRLLEVRSSLAPAFGDWVRDGNGLFILTGLTAAQVEHLKKEFAIYMPSDGRINLSGVTKSNRDYVMKSIEAVKQS